MSDWNALNHRQQTYLRTIYEYDQMQEYNEQLGVALDKRSRPADEWRWILYANTAYGCTPLKQALKDAGMVDPGAGSTFKALQERGYILVESGRITPDPRSALEVDIRLTTKGRRLVRQALGLRARATLPAGTLREWHWRALAHAYQAGPQGMREWPKGIGHLTMRRLEKYRIKGQECPLIERREVQCEPYLRRLWPGDSGYMTDVCTPLCITAFGVQYYRENYQRYREMYPSIEGPDPEV